MSLLQEKSMNLRQELRMATQDVHDRLDSSIDFQTLCDPATYKKFLLAQISARKPIEDWLSVNCPAEIRPPAQVHLLQRDLEAMGAEGEIDEGPPFALDEENGVLGAVWAIAGSSLGNRTILSKLMKQGCKDLPTEFLSDGTMPQFWKTLLQRIEKDASAETIASSCQAAHAVFDRFTNAMGNN